MMQPPRVFNAEGLLATRACAFQRALHEVGMALDSSTRRRAVTVLFQCVFWLALIFAVTMALLPKPPHVLGDAGDKYQHMIAFSCLASLASLGFPDARPLRIAERLSFVGALIEVLQSIPVLKRDCQITDWIADTVAILATLAVIALVRRYWPKG